MNILNKLYFERPIIGKLIIFAVVIGGFISYKGLLKQQFPVIISNIITVETYFPNASPREVEQQITIPLEKEVRNVKGVISSSSVSEDSRSVINLYLDDAIDIGSVVSEVRQSISNVRLPSLVQVPVVNQNINLDPIATIAFYGIKDREKLQSSIKLIKEKIEIIPGIEKVILDGYRDKKIIIELNSDKIKFYQLSVEEIVKTLQTYNYTVSCGKIETYRGTIYVYSSSEINSIQTFKDIIIRSNFSKPSLHLGDIANVAYEFSDSTIEGRIDGNEYISITAYQNLWGDLIKCSVQIQKVIKDTMKQLPEELTYKYLLDSSDDIHRRTKILTSNALLGLLLIIFIIFLLMDASVAFIVIVGIPFSFMSLLICMNILDITLNVISLFGMIIVEGICIDDAIMVSENIYHEFGISKDPKQAVLKGTSEMMLPVTMSVLTTIIAFWPLLSIEGWLGKMARDIPYVITIVLLFSLFDSFFIMPSHMFGLLQWKTKRMVDNGSINSERAWFLNIRDIYGSLLKIILKFRYIFVSCIIVIVFSIGYMAITKMHFAYFPQDLVAWCSLKFEVQKSEEKETLYRKVHSVENYFQKTQYPEYKFIETTIENKDTYFEVRVRIYTDLISSGRSQQILSQARQDLKDILEDSKQDFSDGLSQLQKNSYSLIVQGEDLNKLQDVTISIQTALKQIGGIVDVNDDISEDKVEWKIDIDKSVAQEAGISPERIAENVKYLLGGNIVHRVIQAGQDIDVSVRLKGIHEAKNINEILNQYVISKYNEPIPIHRLVKIKPVKRISSIKHKDFFRAITLTAYFDPNAINPLKIKKKIKELFVNAQQGYEGYTLLFGDEEKDIDKTFSSIGRALFIACSCIAVLLIITFNSIYKPLIIIGIIPISFAASVIILFIHGRPISIMALLGMFSLTGIVINDSIVFVDFMNLYSTQFKTMCEAVIEAGKRRLRQIILTSTTTSVGTLPFAYGWGGKDNILMVMALVITWGIFLATTCTLFLVPSIYLIIDDIKNIRFFKKKT